MKNLFDLATRELTQDAFLRWMFENHGNLQISRELLKNFCEFADGETVESLETKAQWNKIDIAVFIKTNMRKIGLFIEDKTFTSEHDNQLKRYNAQIAKWQESEKGDAYKVFYKPNVISEEEKERAQGANADEAWRIFDIYEINEFFSKYKDSRNLIIAQYVEHILSVYAAVTNVEKPKVSSDKLDLLRWEAYFKSIMEKLSGKDTEYTYGVWQAGRFPVICLNIEKIGEGKKPYLEVTSVDCAENKFKAKIKMHNSLSDEEKEKAEEYREKYFSGKNYEDWIIQKNKHQYACTAKENASSDEQFIELLNKYIKSYLQIMQNWE